MNTELKIEQPIKRNFREILGSWTHKEVENMRHPVVWFFKSKKGQQKYFFLVNNLNKSNYREKLQGCIGDHNNTFQFLREETNEDIILDHTDDGELEFDSIIKLHDLTKKLGKECKSLF